METDSESIDETVSGEGVGPMTPAEEPMDATDDGIIIYPNPEKTGQFRLGEEEYMPMSSSRILLSGMPGSGKRNMILTILQRMKPPPSAVHLVHCDPGTTEYDCIHESGIPLIVYDPVDFPALANIEKPDIDDGADESDKEGAGVENEDSSDDGPKKPLQNPLVIVDEVTTEQLKGEGAKRFERLVNHVATHRNTTVMCSIQSLLNIPPKCRRAFNHFVLWPQTDGEVNKMVARRAGIKPEVLDDLFQACRNKYDNIWVDTDADEGSLWRYRRNLMSPITVSGPGG